MSRFGSMLQQLRSNKKLDLSSMANLLHTTPREVELVEAGVLFPPASVRREWAPRLGFSDLITFDMRWRDRRVRVTQGHPRNWIPVINQAPAGVPVDYHEYGIDSGLGFEYVPRSEGMRDDVLFAVVIFGDSMSPNYQDGDLVIFRPINANDLQPDGCDVFVRFSAARDHTCTFKRLFHVSEMELELRPINPRHESFSVSPDQIDRMALAIETRARYLPRELSTRGGASVRSREFHDDAG